MFDDPGKFSTTSEVFQIEKKNNENIWVEMHTSAIREGGEVIAVEGIIRDITEMKAVQDDLQTSKRAKELMLSYISHELKTRDNLYFGLCNGTSRRYYQRLCGKKESNGDNLSKINNFGENDS